MAPSLQDSMPGNKASNFTRTLQSDVVGIYPNNAALIRLAASLLIEQNDEWLVGRRYMSEASMALVLDRDKTPEIQAPELPAAAA